MAQRKPQKVYVKEGFSRWNENTWFKPIYIPSGCYIKGTNQIAFFCVILKYSPEWITVEVDDIPRRAAFSSKQNKVIYYEEVLEEQGVAYEKAFDEFYKEYTHSYIYSPEKLKELLVNFVELHHKMMDNYECVEIS